MRLVLAGWLSGVRRGPPTGDGKADGQRQQRSPGDDDVPHLPHPRSAPPGQKARQSVSLSRKKRRSSRRMHGGLAAAALVVARARQYDAGAGGDPVPDNPEAARQQGASSPRPTAIEPLVDGSGAKAGHAIAAVIGDPAHDAALLDAAGRGRLCRGPAVDQDTLNDLRPLRYADRTARRRIVVHILPLTGCSDNTGSGDNNPFAITATNR